MADIIDMSQRRSNPFAELRRKQEAARLAAEQESVKEETVTLPTTQQESVKNNQIHDTNSLITIGDETVQNLLKEQQDPLSLQDKLKALFSADIKTNDPFPINARELQTFLGLTKDFSTWMKDMISYGHVEGKDYKVLLPQKGEQKGRGGSNRKDYMLSLDMAQDIAMLQRNSLGALVRAYLRWAEKKLREVTAVISQEQQSTPKTAGDMFMAMAKAFKAQEQRLLAIETGQQEQQQQLDQVSQEQKLISDRVTSLESSNKIERPPAIISKRCKILNGLTTRLAEENVLSYQASKNLCFNRILDVMDHDIDQGLEDYKTACRRYYEWYKINKGTPPKDVLRPAAINNLGWISYVSTNLEIYNNLVILLNSYLEEL